MIVEMVVKRDQDEFLIYYPKDPAVTNVMVWLDFDNPAVAGLDGELPDEIQVEISAI